MALLLSGKQVTPTKKICFIHVRNKDVETKTESTSHSKRMMTAALCWLMVVLPKLTMAMIASEDAARL